jgi:hypothetical protein
MNKGRFLLLGILGGLGYAFISFYLITPQLRHNLIGLLYWGVRGFLFTLAFLLIRILVSRYNNSITFCALNGTVSGGLSCIIDVVVTYYNVMVNAERAGGFVPPELKSDLYSQMGHYLFGCILLGLAIGIGIWSRNKTHNKPVHMDAAKQLPRQ